LIESLPATFSSRLMRSIIIDHQFYQILWFAEIWNINENDKRNL